MKYLLVKEQQYFIDPHGSWDTGKEIYFVSDNEKWLLAHKIYCSEEINEGYFEDQNGNEINTQEELVNAWWELRDTEPDWYAEDGYNREAYRYYVKEITEEEFITHKYLIDQYNKIKF